MFFLGLSGHEEGSCNNRVRVLARTLCPFWVPCSHGVSPAASRARESSCAPDVVRVTLAGVHGVGSLGVPSSFVLRARAVAWKRLAPCLCQALTVSPLFPDGSPRHPGNPKCLQSAGWQQAQFPVSFGRWFLVCTEGLPRLGWLSHACLSQSSADYLRGPTALLWGSSWCNPSPFTALSCCLDPCGFSALSQPREPGRGRPVAVPPCAAAREPGRREDSRRLGTRLACFRSLGEPCSSSTGSPGLTHPCSCSQPAFPSGARGTSGL